MTQTLIRMPQTADVEILGWHVTVWKHRVVFGDLWSKIIGIIMESKSNRETLYEFEKHGITFEAVIEYCAKKFEDDFEVLENIIWDQKMMKIAGTLNTGDRGLIGRNFSKSVTGRKIAAQYTEKIRSCGNWEELYDEMQLSSQFQKNMKSRIIREIKQQCPKV